MRELTYSTEHVLAIDSLSEEDTSVNLCGQRSVRGQCNIQEVIQHIKKNKTLSKALFGRDFFVVVALE